MPTISEIVNVTISRDTTAVTQASFGVMMHLSLSRVFDAGELWREYTNVADMLTDGFKTTDTAYIAANALFSQEVSPEKVIIGQRETQDTVTLTPTVANSTAYTVTINGTAFTYTSDSTALATEIVAGLIAAINAGAEPVTASGTSTLVLNPDVAGVYYSVTSSANLSIALTANQTFAEDIADIRLVNDTWYALTTHSHTKSDVLAIAAAVESLKKIYAVSSSDSDIITSATDDVISELKALGYDRTFAMYHANANTVYPEAAWLGVMLPKDPGSATWKFKTLTGVTANSLSSTQSTYVRNKKGNVYETIGGVDITREGTMVSGEFIDVIVGCDWLESRMEERVYSRLVNSDKIAYTDAGIATIEADIRAQLQEAIAVGFLAEYPQPAVVVPKVANISTVTKATRELPAITFEGTLAGAIHKVTIRGTVTV